MLGSALRSSRGKLRRGHGKGAGRPALGGLRRLAVVARRRKLGSGVKLLVSVRKVECRTFKSFLSVCVCL
uniref:Uncharacterized protein n=1 Tax=Hyaloperonospora arabidopsidis (strain Emoy2) TaxID=559515 RepID=M4C0P8_HYAAE